MIDPRDIEVMDEEMVPILRAMSGAQRLEVANQMWIMTRQMIQSQLAVEHPDWDEPQLQAETARRLLAASPDSLPGPSLRDLVFKSEDAK